MARRLAGVMFFGVIDSDGKKVPPIFAEPGLKINAPAHKHIICRVLKPWVNANYTPGTFVYQHSRMVAYAHSGVNTGFFDELGWHFWQKEEWPAHLPDFAPLDYAIWEPMRRKACAEEAPRLEVLRLAGTNACVHREGLPQVLVSPRGLCCCAGQKYTEKRKVGQSGAHFFFTWHNRTWRNFGVICVY